MFAQYLMAKILFIQPAFAHYRREIFDRLHARHDVTFVFLRGSPDAPCGEVGNPDWRRITLESEKNRFWLFRLLVVMLRQRWAVIITSINGSPQTILSIIVGRLRKIPVVLWSESWGAPYRSIGAPWWKRAYRRARTRWTTARAGAVVVAGSRSKEYHQTLGVDSGRLFVANYSTIDMRSLIATDFANGLPGCSGHAVRILYFSRVVKSKGLDVLIRAFAEIEKLGNDVHLQVVGDGEFRPYCEKLAGDLQVQNIRFHGAVPNEEAWKYFKQADVFVLPCSGKGRGEGWGLVINEAMSMSLPIVTTEAVGAVADLVNNGVNGYVVAPGDADDLRKALERLLFDEHKRESMGRESRRLFDGFNDYGKMHEGFENAIQHVLKQRKRT